MLGKTQNLKGVMQKSLSPGCQDPGGGKILSVPLEKFEQYSAFFIEKPNLQLNEDTRSELEVGDQDRDRGPPNAKTTIKTTVTF